MEDIRIKNLKKARAVVSVADTIFFLLIIGSDLFMRILHIPSPWNYIVFYGLEAIWILLILATAVLDKKIDSKPLWKNVNFYFFILLSCLLVFLIISHFCYVLV